MNTKFCPNCGTKLDINTKFCPNCGAETRNISSNEEQSEIKSAVTVFCPNCGKEVNENLPICPNCGAKINNRLDNLKPNINSIIYNRNNNNSDSNFNSSNFSNSVHNTRNVKKNKRPKLALFLSFIFPGFGQLYEGQYIKALSLIVASVISSLLMIIYIGIFLYLIVWVYGMYDAYYTAKKINNGEEIEDTIKI